MRLTLPNVLTWLRIVAIPLLVGVFYTPTSWLSVHEQNVVAGVIFVLAAITDWLDGYLARRMNQTSAFGAFLDPVADKLIVVAALILLLKLDRVDAVVALIIIGREVAISALREWMANIGAAKSVAVSFLGKVKTAAQMIAIPMLLVHDTIEPPHLDAQLVGTWLICIAALLTVVSMLYYLRAALPQVIRHERGK
jgi:CDP-diacylglycerol--glycerol-3-phosphate 3-phosphatidyltransferase/cardiolipin synthase